MFLYRQEERNKDRKGIRGMGDEKEKEGGRKAKKNGIFGEKVQRGVRDGREEGKGKDGK